MALGERLEAFRKFRAEMNEKILASDNLVIKRFFNLDTQTYHAGALDARTKEMLGLVASLVLRCDDCITYHLIRCKEEGVTREELFEVLSVGLVVGGSIVIPHLRRAVATWEELEQEASSGSGAEAAPRATEQPPGTTAGSPADHESGSE